MRRIRRLCLLLTTLLSLAGVFSGCAAPDEREIPSLIKQLSNRDAAKRNQAALALAAYGPKAKPAVTRLIRLLDDPNRGVQSGAAYALRQIGSQEASQALDEKELRDNQRRH